MSPRLHEIEEAIQHLPPQEQRQLLAELPRLLHLPPADLEWLKLSEPAFRFWDNSDDAVYDRL